MRGRMKEEVEYKEVGKGRKRKNKRRGNVITEEKGERRNVNVKIRKK